MKKIQNKRPLIILVAMIQILTIPGCHKEELILEREYPRLDICDEIFMSDEGALFEAFFLTQNVDILDKGFVWGEGVYPDVEKESHISLGEGAGNGAFSKTAAFDLVSGRGYYVHAYAVTAERLVYSKAVPFVCTTNGPGLALDSFTPGRGRANDTVVISGSNLSYHSGRIKVLFSNVNAEINGCTDTTITVSVPEILSSKAKISVTINGLREEFDDFFITDGK